MKSTIVSSILSNMIFVLFFLAVYFFKNQKCFKKPEIKKLSIYSCLCLVSFCLLLPVIYAVQFGLDHLGFYATSLDFSINAQNIILAIIFLALLPAVCEELFFRATVFKLLEPYGKAFSIISSALFFALMHLSINQFVYPLLMGLLFGIIMYKENNIIYTIVLHFINNLLALVLSLINVNLFSNSAWYYALAVIFLGLFILILSKLFMSTKETGKRKISKKALTIMTSVSIIVVIFWTLAVFVA